MEYNDFPILNDNEYLKIKSNYQINNPDLNIIIIETYNKLASCKSLCLCIDKNINKNVYKEIENARNYLNDLCLDLTFSYNIAKQDNTAFEKFDLFKLLKQLINTISYIKKNKSHINSSFEKTLLSSIENKLIFILEKIIESLNKTSIHIFKYF